jgi:predicted DNA repair protein MutK
MPSTTESSRRVLRDTQRLDILKLAVLAVVFGAVVYGLMAAMSAEVSTAYDDLGTWLEAQASAL